MHQHVMTNYRGEWIKVMTRDVQLYMVDLVRVALVEPTNVLSASTCPRGPGAPRADPDDGIVLRDVGSDVFLPLYLHAMGYASLHRALQVPRGRLDQPERHITSHKALRRWANDLGAACRFLRFDTALDELDDARRALRCTYRFVLHTLDTPGLWPTAGWDECAHAVNYCFTVRRSLANPEDCVRLFGASVAAKDTRTEITFREPRPVPQSGDYWEAVRDWEPRVPWAEAHLKQYCAQQLSYPTQRPVAAWSEMKSRLGERAADNPYVFLVYLRDTLCELVGKEVAESLFADLLSPLDTAAALAVLCDLEKADALGHLPRAATHPECRPRNMMFEWVSYARIMEAIAAPRCAIDGADPIGRGESTAHLVSACIGYPVGG